MKLPEKANPVLSLQQAKLSFGRNIIWQNVDLDIYPGEFVVVLGPNGSGKTTLLKSLLGLQTLTSGQRILASNLKPQQISYIPQHHGWNDAVGLRGRDLVGLGLNGNQYGWRPANKTLVNHALHQVGASAYGDQPLEVLSGGQRQRLRTAAAIVAKPAVLFCDEPFISLDLAGQQTVAYCINQLRQDINTAVVFVTHDINPVLEYADKVVYVAGGRVLVGKPSEVLTSKKLSELYGVPIEVQHIHGKLVVLGQEDNVHAEAAGGHHG